MLNMRIDNSITAIDIINIMMVHIVDGGRYR